MIGLKALAATIILCPTPNPSISWSVATTLVILFPICIVKILRTPSLLISRISPVNLNFPQYLETTFYDSHKGFYDIEVVNLEISSMVEHFCGLLEGFIVQWIISLLFAMLWVVHSFCLFIE